MLSSSVRLTSCYWVVRCCWVLLLMLCSSTELCYCCCCCCAIELSLSMLFVWGAVCMNWVCLNFEHAESVCLSIQTCNDSFKRRSITHKIYHLKWWILDNLISRYTSKMNNNNYNCESKELRSNTVHMNSIHFTSVSGKQNANWITND